MFVALLTALATVPVARAQPAGIAVVDLDGKGFGHGVGLSQWGAMYMAEAGQSHDDILSTFYPGTSLSSYGSSDVRVAVYNAPDGRATLSFPNGGQVLSSPGGGQAPGFPIDVPPGGAVNVSFDGGTYRATPAFGGLAASTAATWTAPTNDGCIPVLGPCGGPTDDCGLLGCPAPPPPADTVLPPTNAPPATGGGTTFDPGGGGAPGPPPPAPDPSATSSAPLWASASGGGTVGVNERGRHYRGLVEATGGGGPLRLVNQVNIETYLKGMGEVPGGWPSEAVGAQAVVARTYALKAMSGTGELCDYDLCQVYVGADGESGGQSAAVNATSGQVLTYNGGLATTVYSADAGGVSATTLEGFGTDDGDRFPYLTTVHYDTPNPLPWRTEIALSDIASRFGYGGSLDSLTLGDQGPSGRALSVVLRGSNGETAVDGRQFASRLGLRSTLFTASIALVDTAPPPPEEGGALQLFPDDGAGLQTAATTVPGAGGAAAAAHPRVPKAVGDLARRPATWIALGILVLVTALALGRYGIEPPLLASAAGGRLRLPDWTLGTWSEAWGHLARGLGDRPAAKTSPAGPVTGAQAGTGRGDTWRPRFPQLAHPPRRAPLRAAGRGGPSAAPERPAPTASALQVVRVRRPK
ncbi:MAG: SpoIID/LytB domain-containing protein [Acidimicrobiales bacterium]